MGGVSVHPGNPPTPPLGGGGSFPSSQDPGTPQLLPRTRLLAKIPHEGTRKQNRYSTTISLTQAGRVYLSPSITFQPCHWEVGVDFCCTRLLICAKLLARARILPRARLLVTLIRGTPPKHAQDRSLSRCADFAGIANGL